jgi:hypothetical protein
LNTSNNMSISTELSRYKPNSARIPSLNCTTLQNLPDIHQQASKKISAPCNLFTTFSYRTNLRPNKTLPNRKYLATPLKNEGLWYAEFPDIDLPWLISPGQP